MQLLSLEILALCLASALIEEEEQGYDKAKSYNTMKITWEQEKKQS